MKIYTKTGDKGETSLYGGQRVKKSDLAVETYGTFDELNSLFGICVHQLNLEISNHPELKSVKSELENVQRKLFDAGVVLSTPPKNHSALPENSVFSEKDTQILEKHMDSLEKQLPELRDFILPSGPSHAGAHIHLARTVSRRAERLLVDYVEKYSESSTNSKNLFNLIAYANRLSDWLFVCARYCNIQVGGPDSETKWNP